MKQKLFLILFWATGLFFSFYRLPQQYIFEYDREGNYSAAKSIVIDHKLSLIGPAVHSSIYMGPWFNYFQVPFFIIFSGNPIYGAYMMALINFVVYFLIYHFLKKVGRSQLVAFCGALLWVSSANRFNSLITFVPLFFMVFLLIFEKFKLKRTIKSLALLTLVWSLSLNFHPQMIFLAPVWLYSILLFFQGNNKHRLKSGIIILIALLIPATTVIIFDFRHNFPILHAVIRFFSGEVAPVRSDTAGFRLAYSVRQLSLPISLPLNWLNHNPLFSVLLLSLGAFIVSLERRLFYLLLISLTSVLLLSSYQQKTWPEYYHQVGGLSLLLLLLIASVETKVTKFILVFLTIIIVWGNLRYLISYIDPLSYFYKKQVILYMLSENKPYDKMNIINDFPFGEGLGFGPIREFYERRTGQYPPLLKFFVSYRDNPKHNQTKKAFGAFAVSKIYE